MAYERGHGIPCKHCGHQLTVHLDHSLLEEEDPRKRRKGYRLALAKRHKYVPKDRKAWERAERACEQSEENLHNYNLES